jgi:hypothetical protein
MWVAEVVFPPTAIIMCGIRADEVVRMILSCFAFVDLYFKRKGMGVSFLCLLEVMVVFSVRLEQGWDESMMI